MVTVKKGNKVSHNFIKYKHIKRYIFTCLSFTHRQCNTEYRHQSIRGNFWLSKNMYTSTSGNSLGIFDTTKERVPGWWFPDGDAPVHGNQRCQNYLDYVLWRNQQCKALNNDCVGKNHSYVDPPQTIWYFFITMFAPVCLLLRCRRFSPDVMLHCFLFGLSLRVYVWTV